MDLGEKVSRILRACDPDNSVELAVAEVTKEMGSTKNVLGLLEGNGIEGHADGGFAVAVDDAGAVDGKSKVVSISSSRMKITSLAASMAPKNSASALDSVTDRCILENQWKRHP